MGLELLRPGDPVCVIQRESGWFTKSGRVVDVSREVVVVRFPDCPRLWPFGRKWLRKLLY